MSKFNKKVFENKNKKGNVIERVIQFTPKTDNGRISIQEVNKLHQELIKTKDPKAFMIKFMTIDGMKTIKPFDYIDDDLKYALENYYSSLPTTAQEKFKHYMSVQIIVR